MVVSAGHVGGARGSGTVSSAADALWMSVVRGMRGVGGVCEMCMCLARVGVAGEGSEWIRGLGLDVFMCLGCGGVCGEWVGCFGPGSGVVGWCYYVLVSCESGLSVYMTGPCISIWLLADIWAS